MNRAGRPFLLLRHYLEILSRNIDTYERNIFPAEHDPIENLNYLLEDHGMTASDLGRILVGLVVAMGPVIHARSGVPADTNSLGAREAITAAAAANNEFGLDLFARLRQQEGNLFFSPYSVSTALALTYTGARGRTLDQMARTLHWCRPCGQGVPWSAAQLGRSMGVLIQDRVSGSILFVGRLADPEYSLQSLQPRPVFCHGWPLSLVGI